MTGVRRGLRLAWEYALFAACMIGLGAGTLLWSVLAWLAYPFLTRQRGQNLGRRGAMWGFRFYLWCLETLRAADLDLHELDALRDAGPLIIAPNHPSLMDALVIVSRLPDVVCVMKADVLDNPFFGAGARLARYIRNDASMSGIRLGVDALREGGQLLLFPEGTRTVQEPVNPFKGGTVLVAKRANVPIQTVFIRMNSAFLCKGWPLWRKPPRLPVRIEARLGRRFAPRDDLGTLQSDLQAYFRTELSRDGTSAEASRALESARSTA